MRRCDDPAIAALRHRVHIVEDPAMTAAVPRPEAGARDADA